MKTQRHGASGPGLRSDFRRFRTALFITLGFMAVEIVGGILSRSLSLLADAGHMAADAGALGLGLFAAWLGSRPRTFEKTFGWRRFEIFAAFVNGVGLWALAAIIAWEAFRRLRTPVRPSGWIMLGVAAVGLAANLASAYFLHGGRNRSLNVKGAYLHVLADALGSVAVLVSALIIQITGWTPADPLAAGVIAVLIAFGSTRLVRESFHILMEGAPGHLKAGEIRAALSDLAGVRSVHDFHLWTVSSGWVSLSAHLEKRPEADADAILAGARLVLRDRFNIEHATLQVESPQSEACSTGSCEEEETPGTPPLDRS
jgi:cobalt-zinc-cadmium efflux system protein